MVYPIIKRTIFPWTRLYTRKVNGIKNLPENAGFIVAANHASYMDHLMISAIIIPHYNQKLYFLAKKEHFESPYQRIWHEHVGAIPIDRKKGGKRALKIAIGYLRKGKIIGIYPEGTRTLTGKMQKGKTGVAVLALGAKVPVLPVGLIGTFQILPKGKFIPRFKRAVVNIGRPMYFDKYYEMENNKKVLRIITTKIMKEIAGLSGQRYNF